MSVCALVGKVAFNHKHFLKQGFDYVIAVDAGYGHLEAAGVVPDMVVGDFDSLGFTPVHENVLSFPEQKDESDIELALYEAAAAGFDTLVIYGCLGGRMDFSYAVLQMIAHFSREGRQVFGIGDTYAVTALVGGGRDSISFSGDAQGTLSVFAVDPEVTGVTETGLAYSLDGATVTYGKPLGVSNAFTGRHASISVGSGTLLVFFPLEAWNCRE